MSRKKKKRFTVKLNVNPSAITAIWYGVGALVMLLTFRAGSQMLIDLITMYFSVAALFVAEKAYTALSLLLLGVGYSYAVRGYWVGGPFL